ncbi:ras-like protein family member 11A-like isoform X2 [Pungitius pungitius]|uniref:ras-like protein family member 11A-like isoform X2 n=1 Tax=Pungitius pungitius TaxID=134920 RepID=UPI002E1537F7
MRLSGDPAPATMSSGGGSGNFLLVPIPEYPLLDCVPNKTVKIVVLGASNVGKTALIVRFLTKRFIGDYEANTGALYSRKVALEGEEVSLQIQDTPCVALQDDAEGLHCQEQINRSIYWADGYVLVYSITDLHSYRTIQPLYQHVRRIHPSGNIPVILVNPRGKQERPAEGPAGAGGGGRGARGYARRILLRGLGQREPRGSPRHLPPPLSGGGPGAGGGQR